MKPKLLLASLLLAGSATAQNVAPYWSLTGNSNATTATKLGTTNAVPLRFLTNNVERLRIDAAGRIGIGTNVSPGKLTLHNNGSVPSAAWKVTGVPVFVGYSEATPGNGDFINFMASNTATARPVFTGRRSRGTLAAPLPVAKGDILTSLTGFGYDGANFQFAAGIDILADGAATAGSVPGKMYFYTGTSANNRSARLTIGSKGDVIFNKQDLFVQSATGRIGVGTTFPEAKLHVNGESLFNETIRIRSQYLGLEVNADDTAEYDVHSEVGISSYADGAGIHAVGTYRSGTGVVAYGGTAGISARGGYWEGAGLFAVGEGAPAFSASTDAESTTAGYIQAPKSRGLTVVAYEEGIHALSTTTGIRTEGATGILAVGTDYAGYFDGDVIASGSYLTSDRKLKRNISEFTGALDLIASLQPRVYEYRNDASLKPLNLPKGTHYGLVAQEVEQVLPGLVKTTSHRIYHSSTIAPLKDGGKMSVPSFAPVQASLNENRKNSTDMEIKAVNYTELIPVLVKAIQEQQVEINRLKEEMALLRGPRPSSLSNSFLEEIQPNPSRGMTTIRYRITEGAGTLIVSDAAGRQIASVGLRGSGSHELNTAKLAGGIYRCALVVGGNIVSVKSLTVIR